MKQFYNKNDIIIYNCDCRNINIESVDLLLTDPPYGVNFEGKINKYTTVKRGGYTYGDNDIGPEVIRKLLPNCKRAIVFTGNRLLHNYPKPVDIGCAYCPAGAGRGPWGFTCFNPILFYGKRQGGPKSPSSFTSHFLAKKNGHPCPKPIEWMEWAVRIGSKEGDLILDPFIGSGTTLVAAKKLRRKAIGIEISEEYCEIAVRRLEEKHTRQIDFIKEQKLTKKIDFS